MGNYVLEILSHEQLVNRLIDTMGLVGFRNLQHYNPTGMISTNGPAQRSPKKNLTVRPALVAGIGQWSTLNRLC